mmetsp:Transcript_64348/g.178183  ORF Transcript_64348/g.178183 Transcript_64348/m.178183 type:complete len:268 (+) Transcript_64348:356-1159(+)
MPCPSFVTDFLLMLPARPSDAAAAAACLSEVVRPPMAESMSPRPSPSADPPAVGGPPTPTAPAAPASSALPVAVAPSSRAFFVFSMSTGSKAVDLATVTSTTFSRSNPSCSAPASVGSKPLYALCRFSFRIRPEPLSSFALISASLVMIWRLHSSLAPSPSLSNSSGSEAHTARISTISSPCVANLERRSATCIFLMLDAAMRTSQSAFFCLNRVAADFVRPSSISMSVDLSAISSGVSERCLRSAASQSGRSLSFHRLASSSFLLM